ncbi:MAG TPA: glycosyltransferase [Bacteroidales bacterium]|nr:glycosyltransferase [Bacteroidales bacterium]
MEKSVLIISFWNPVPQMPFKGLFIHEQVKALSNRNSNLIFLEVNILPSKALFKKEVKKQPFNLSQKLTINIYSCFWKFIYVNPWFAYRIIKTVLKKEVPSFRPSLVHSNIIYPCGISGYFLAKDFKAKHIISEHWSKATSLLKHPFYKRITYKAYSESKAVLCVSRFLEARIRQAASIENTHIVPNIIDTSMFGYKTKELDDNYITFTCAAHWSKPKRLDLILESLRIFAKSSQKTIRLNIVGNGNQTDAYHNQLFENIEVNWLGYIPKSEIPTVLNVSDYFLHASETETFSIVIGEALCTGTPVLASNTGAIPELINEKNGLLVNNTIESWVDGLYKIVNTSFNNSLIASSVSNKYSPEIVSREIENIYKELLDNKS